MISNKLFIDIATFCFQNKITLEMHYQADFNSAHFEKNENKLIFIININNEKDKNLPNIINNGLEKLKNFIKQIPTE